MLVLWPVPSDGPARPAAVCARLRVFLGGVCDPVIKQYAFVMLSVTTANHAL